MTYKYIRPTSLKDCPSLKRLYEARKAKREVWSRLKRNRDYLPKARTDELSMLTHLRIVGAAAEHAEAVLIEQRILSEIEEYANTQGLTTKKGGNHA